MGINSPFHLREKAHAQGRGLTMNTLCGILLGASVALAQQAPVPTPAPNAEKNGVVFSVTSTLVQVDAVVTDGKGRNIADLAPDDFQVLIDGKPQPLTHFSYVRLSTAAPTTAPNMASAHA